VGLATGGDGFTTVFKADSGKNPVLDCKGNRSQTPGPPCSAGQLVPVAASLIIGGNLEAGKLTTKLPQELVLLGLFVKSAVSSSIIS